MTTTMTKTENAAAGPSDSSVMFSRMRTVISVQPIETRKIVALIAVMERMNTTPTPAKKAGITSGSVMRRNVVTLRAPRLREASSRLLSICCNSATVVRMPVGRVAEHIAGDDDQRRAGQRDRRIVEGDQIAMPTMVPGSA